MTGGFYPLLLRLWRVLPLPGAARALLLWWTNPHYLIAVSGCLFDEQGRLLLGRHSYLPPPGWGLPGGTVRASESLEAAVQRELAEELGLAVEVGSLLAWVAAPCPRRMVFAFACYRRAGEFRPSAEILDAAYFPLGEAIQLVRPEGRVLLERIAARRANAE